MTEDLKILIFFGVIPAVIGKILLEFFLNFRFDFVFFRCFDITRTISCSLQQWLLNPSDLLVMVPIFVFGILIGLLTKTG